MLGLLLGRRAADEVDRIANFHLPELLVQGEASPEFEQSKIGTVRDKEKQKKSERASA